MIGSASIRPGRKTLTPSKLTSRASATWSCWSSWRADISRSRHGKTAGCLGSADACAAIAKSPTEPGAIVGYGGLWKIEGEAHVSTIATHPDWRGHGFGEILLAGMFGKALRLNAEFIVLEVRVSNAVAQSLYRKYGFCRFGRKKNYYRNDKEDAWDMRVALTQEARPRFEQLYDKLRLQHGFQDNYSFVSHPRR